MSMKNVLAGAQVVLRNGDPLEELRFGKSNLPALSSSTGEFNAYDTKELINAISNLMTAVASGQVTERKNSSFSTSEEYSKQQRARRELVAEAYQDQTGEKWAALGASIALQLQEQTTREGFLRRVSIGQTLKQGEIARVAMTAWDAVAIVATSSTNVGYQVVRHKVFYPSEFEITANLRAEQIEIEQVSGDILDDLYTQGLDATMVKEDRLFKQAADLAVGVVNPLQYISGQLTPGMLAALRNAVTDWNLPAKMAIISNDYWTDITGNSDFGTFLDPVNKYDLVLNGYLGQLSGLDLLTDGFRQPNQKVLNRGEIYVLGSPENLSAYTDRGGIRATPTSGADQGNTSKGFLLSEIFSFILANPRAVSVGKRL